MHNPTEALRRVKFWCTQKLSSRTYWYLMGKWRPVPAVTSEYATIEESMESGRAVVDLLNQLGVVGENMVTLQIGSGLGRVEYHLRSEVRKCWGIDVSPSMVRRARALVSSPNVEFVVSDGATLSLWPDSTFDLIYSFLVFQHLPRSQFECYLQEARSKLSAGGHLVFQLMVDETGKFSEPPVSHPYGLRYYRREEVEAKLREAGFTSLSRCGLKGEPDKLGATGDVVFCARKL